MSPESPIQRRAQPRPENWLQRVGSWFRFINRRRLDERFGVLPPRLVAPWFALLFFIPIALINFTDRTYLLAVRSGATKGNWFFETITHLGLSDWILYLSGGAMLTFSVLTADRYRGSLHRLWHRLMLTTYFIFTAVAFSGLVTALLKLIFGRLRPPFVKGEGPWEVVPFTPGYDFASFPSGHATTSMALAVALALLLPHYRWWLIGLGLLVAVSRNFIGVHFPSDVAAGILIGGGFTFFWARSFARKRLLFHFTGSGKLALRGEGKGQLTRLPEMVRPGGGK